MWDDVRWCHMNSDYECFLDVIFIFLYFFMIRFLCTFSPPCPPLFAIMCWTHYCLMHCLCDCWNGVCLSKWPNIKFASLWMSIFGKKTIFDCDPAWLFANNMHANTGAARLKTIIAKLKLFYNATNDPRPNCLGNNCIKYTVIKFTPTFEAIFIQWSCQHWNNFWRKNITIYCCSKHGLNYNLFCPLKNKCIKDAVVYKKNFFIRRTSKKWKHLLMEGDTIMFPNSLITSMWHEYVSTC